MFGVRCSECCIWVLGMATFETQRMGTSSPARSGLVSDARLKVRLARFKMEAQERERQAEYDLRFNIRKLEIEAEKAVEIRRLELEEASRRAGRSTLLDYAVPVSAGTSFDVCMHLTLVPQFRETEVEAYFDAFERIAASLRWPRDVWSLLLQSKLSGKAQQVVATLFLEDSLCYETVKAAVLRAYGLVPDTYRHMFRSHKKSAGSTFLEFAREKQSLFDRWCAASNVSDFAQLRDMILLEEFRSRMPERVGTYLNREKRCVVGASSSACRRIFCATGAGVCVS